MTGEKKFWEANIINFEENPMMRKVKSNLEAGQLVEARRSRMDIIADILSTSLNGTRKTQLMCQTNLNFSRREKYVEELIRLGLMEVGSNSPVTYITTERGQEWLKNYEKIKLA